jgi:hypothetical protein
MLTYAITIFTGAFLLFQVEPLLARYILPWFGGTSAVWITCMLFFQLLLVVGYAYSHLIATRLRPRMQAIVHIAIISACVLLMGTLSRIWQSPITPGPNWKPLNPDFPITRIFILLVVSIGLPGDYIRFYEINPAVTEIATDEDGYFTYLRDSRAKIEVVPGDARLSMERELANGNPQAFDVLVLDAFAGDAIPVHLLTIEAFATYLRELNPDGVLAIHVTNRYLDLGPWFRE